MSKGYPEACTFSEVLEHFKNEAQQEELYRLCNQDAILQIAQSIDDVSPLSVQDRHLFCTAPVNIRKPPVFDVFVRFVQRCAAWAPFDAGTGAPPWTSARRALSCVSSCAHAQRQRACE